MAKSKSSTRKILHLNLLREHFARIAARKKKVEYRDITSYWKSRMEGRTYDVVVFRNGYSSRAPEIVAEFRGVGRRKKRGKTFFAIRIGRILKIKRWRG